MVTLFMLSVLYDRAGSNGKQGVEAPRVFNSRSIHVFMYFALAMFFTGFIYMVQLTVLVQ